MITQSGMIGQVYRISHRMRETTRPETTKSFMFLESDLSFLFLETSQKSPRKARNINRAPPTQMRPERPKLSPPRANAKRLLLSSVSVSVPPVEVVSVSGVSTTSPDPSPIEATPLGSA